MIYIYTPGSSSGARLLAGALEYGKRVRGVPALKQGDFLINWGHQSGLKGPHILNANLISNKLRELTRLELKGVSVPKFALAPFPGAIGRSRVHTGGDDLLNPPGNPDFWVKKLTIETEYRFHIFRGTSIRAGIKRVRPEVREPHSWIRSWEGGWSIYYDLGKDQFPSGLRSLAKKAIEALGLDFGAVDVGSLADGKKVVLEVNTAPGLEGPTIQSYARAVQGWTEAYEL